MRTFDIKRDLVALGIDPEDYRVLKLLPLVYVAWADGKMERVERHRIVKLANEASRNPCARCILKTRSDCFSSRQAKSLAANRALRAAVECS